MNKSDLIGEVLDDTEKLAVQIFVDNEKQREAVKKVLLFEIYNNGVLKKGEAATPLRNSALGLAAVMNNPEEIGKRLLAMWEGINFLEQGFKQLEKFSKKDKNTRSNEINPAR